MYPMAENCHVIPCTFCGTWTGPSDQNSMLDRAGIYCGDCVHRLDLDGELILSCGLCKMPILGATFVIVDENHGWF